MNPLERATRAVDAFQRRHTVPSFAFGVVKKFGDDNGGILVANLAYSGFLSLFPLLLLAITLTGLLLGTDSIAEATIRDAIATRIPLAGAVLLENLKGLRRDSLFGIVVGLVGLAWGSTGLAQAGQFAMAQVWNIPGVYRPNYFQRLARSAGFLAVLGLGVLLSTALSVYGTLAASQAILVGLGTVASIAANMGVFLLAFRVLTPRRIPARRLVPGALVAGFAWSVLQFAGTFVVGHYLRTDNALYGTFGIVLGLVAFVYLTAEITLYAAELNAVLAYRLWPRSLVQPPLTEADRTSLTLQATQNTRRPEQVVHVGFTTAPVTGPPADPVAAPPLVTLAAPTSSGDSFPAGTRPPHEERPPPDPPGLHSGEASLRSGEAGLHSEEMSVHLET